MNDDAHDPLQTLWREQPCPPLEYDMTTIIERATTLETKIRRRNQVEGIAAWIVLATGATYLVGAIVIEAPPVLIAGCIAMMAAAWFVRWVLGRFGQARTLPDPSIDARAFVTAYRETLTGQARLLGWAWLWYVGPMVLAVVLIDRGVRAWVEQTTGSSMDSPTFLYGALALAGVIAVLNLAAAAKLRQQRAALDR